MSWLSERSIDGGIDAVPLPSEVDGSMWLCGKRVVGPDPEAALGRVGADTIVCFNERAELLRDYPDYVTWLDTEPASRALWWPIPDLGAPPIATAHQIADVVQARLVGGAGLILHCAGGIGRAPTMAICVLVRLGMAVAEATAHVAAHRPTGGPEAGPQRELLAAFVAS